MIYSYSVSRVFGSLSAKPDNKDAIAFPSSIDLSYKNDRKNGERSALPKVTFVLASTQKKDVGILNGPLDFINANKITNLDPIPVGITPILTVGAEYEDVIRSTKRRKGDAWRTIAKYQWEITGNEPKSDWNRVILSYAALV